MPETRVLIPPVAAKELVPLDELNAALRLDLDPVLVAAYMAGPLPETADPALVGQLKYVERLGRAARKKVEAYTGRYFAPQTLSVSYTLEEPYDLPSGSKAVSVSGYFDTLEALAARGSWLVEYQKGISINRQLPLQAAFAQTYTVVAEVAADAEYSDLAAAAVTELVGEWYKNRETSGDTRLAELPVSWRVKLAEARVTVLGFGS
jgi:hypothetical protein